jgi:hypothetical protein
MPEEGIEVLTWSLVELSQAMVDGRFDHALHVAVVMIAVLKGGVKLPWVSEPPSEPRP